MAVDWLGGKALFSGSFHHLQSLVSSLASLVARLWHR